jgi:hypothetical protein
MVAAAAAGWIETGRGGASLHAWGLLHNAAAAAASLVWVLLLCLLLLLLPATAACYCCLLLLCATAAAACCGEQWVVAPHLWLCVLGRGAAF